VFTTVQKITKSFAEKTDDTSSLNNVVL